MLCPVHVCYIVDKFKGNFVKGRHSMLLTYILCALVSVKICIHYTGECINVCITVYLDNTGVKLL